MTGLGPWLLISLNNWYVVWEILECNSYGHAYRLDPKRTASSYCHSASKIKYQGNSILFPTKPFFGFIKPSQVLITDHFIHEAGYEWFACQHSCSVVVSFPVEEDTNLGSNPGGSKKKIPLLATQKIMAGHRPVAPVVGLGPPTKGSWSSRQPSGSWLAYVKVRPYRMKPRFKGFLDCFGWGFF